MRNVRDLQDHNFYTPIDLARGFLVVHLSELLKHQFHGSHLRGEGTAFRMRTALTRGERMTLTGNVDFAPFPEFRSPAVGMKRTCLSRRSATR